MRVTTAAAPLSCGIGGVLGVMIRCADLPIPLHAGVVPYTAMATLPLA
jgi:hypothetical protein